jgi:DNA adenine methylase
VIPVAPFLKWPGGKRWATVVITSVVRRYLRGAYIEPFVGGGAVFFALRPSRALLGDINPELVNAYKVVRDRPREVVRRLRMLEVSARQYYALRSATPKGRIERAVRLLYLNRTAFGGIYRLNREGDFNVPFGGGERSPAVLWERELLVRAASALKDVAIECADFATVMGKARAGDVVYCDPTYTVAHENNGFVRYNERNFHWTDQLRLAEAARDASNRGAAVIVSNAFHPSVRRVFSPPKALVLRRRSLVARSADARREVREYLFVFPPIRSGHAG